MPTLINDILPTSFVYATDFDTVLDYKGTLDASLGSYPATPKTGDLYKISVAGTISSTTYEVLDQIYYDGASWVKINEVLDQISRVDTVADLRNIAKDTVNSIHVLGHTALGDGGGGIYWYDSTDTTSTDNDGTLIVASDGGRWKYAEYQSINLATFGLTPSSSNNETRLNRFFVAADGTYKSAILNRGTYTFNITTPGTPPCQIVNAVSIVAEPGCEFLITASSTTTTKVEEETNHLISCGSQSYVRIRGPLKFNGNKNAGTDPKAGLIKFTDCTDVLLDGLIIEDSSIGFSFPIDFIGTGSFLENIRVENCTFNKCTQGVRVGELFTNVKIKNNTFKNMELSDPNTGYSYLSNTLYSGRCIRFNGYITTTSASGNIGNAEISGNVIDGATYGIECWNQDATNGQNPDVARGISITNNMVHAIYCIGSNSFGGVDISGNPFVVRQVLDAAGVTAYLGTKQITDTSSHYGAGIEARPGDGITVANNYINMQYDYSASPDLTASSAAITVGTSVKNIKCEAQILNNSIIKAYAGIDIRDCQKTIISNNKILECRRPVYSEKGTNSYGYAGNSFVGNRIECLPDASGTDMAARFYGEWSIRDNEFIGDDADELIPPLLQLNDTAGRYELSNNLFENFVGEAVDDYAIRSTYNGDRFFGSGGGGTWGAITIHRQNWKTFRVDNIKCEAMSSVFSWVGAAASNESYVGGTATITNISNLHKSKSGGTIYDLPMQLQYLSSAPATGYWAAGSRAYNINPSEGQTSWICIVSGSPGTWVVDGAISSIIEEETGTTYTLVAGDEKNKLKEFNNASAIAVTVPFASSVAFATGAEIPCVQKGAGQVTFVGDTVAATGTVTLTGGASGSVDSITVNGVEILSSSVAFNTTLDQTATDVAANITANTSSPDYNASAVGSVITITAVTPGSGTNTFAVVSTATTITTSDVDMAGGDEVVIHSAGSLLSLSGQYSPGTLIKKSETDEWYLFGDLA